jgi:hypothetical protein
MLATLALPLALGGVETMILSSSLAVLSALITFLDKENGPSWRPGRTGLVLLLTCMLILGLLDSGGRLLGLPTLHWLDLPPIAIQRSLLRPAIPRSQGDLQPLECLLAY